MSVRYFTTSDAYIPPTILRRTDGIDEAFVSGVWRPTSAIIDWEYGREDSVDEVTEERARALVPLAFAV